MKTNLYIYIFYLIFLFGVLACKESATTAVPKLTNELSSKDRGVRNRAALKLASYGQEAKDAVPALINLLADPNGGVRSSAAFALREIKDKRGLEAIDTYQK